MTKSGFLSYYYYKRFPAMLVVKVTMADEQQQWQTESRGLTGAPSLFLSLPLIVRCSGRPCPNKTHGRVEAVCLAGVFTALPNHGPYQTSAYARFDVGLLRRWIAPPLAWRNPQGHDCTLVVLHMSACGLAEKLSTFCVSPWP